MTRTQARHALSAIGPERAKAARIYTNGGAILRGALEYDEDIGLLILDRDRAFTRAEQCAALEVVS